MKRDAPETTEVRTADLSAAHMVSLEDWRRGAMAGGRVMPHFDPRDGGDRARVLILLETPGPGHAPVRFVSRDNPTGTARNLGRFLDEAGIRRENVVVWNVVPWIVHAPGARNRPVRRAEIVEGLTLLPGLIALLPRLEAALLAGRPAAQAAPLLAARWPAIRVVTMPHPSPTYVCTSPLVAVRIGAAMAEVAGLLNARGGA